MTARSKRGRNELFAPIPARAIADNRLSARHLRVLAAIALHDRFSRNGQGCWAGRKRLAAETGCSETHVSDATGDLRRFGYIASQSHPMNRRTIVHRVLYEADNTSQIRDLSSENTSRTDSEHQSSTGPADGTVSNPNRSRSDHEQVPTKNHKSLGENEEVVSNILGINLIRDSGEPERRDSAEAGTSDKGKRDIEGIERYLTDVEACLSDQATSSVIKFEYPRLAQIAADEILPEIIRERAASLRDLAA